MFILFLGGVIATLFTSLHPEHIDGLCLVSPLFALSRRWTDFVDKQSSIFGSNGSSTFNVLSQVFHNSVHFSQKILDWEWNTKLKPLNGFPVSVDWISNLQQIQRKIDAGGVSILAKIPVLVLCSCVSIPIDNVSQKDDAVLVDVIMDVKKVVLTAPKIGKNIQVSLIKDGVHDLFLSCKDTKTEVYRTILKYFSNVFTTLVEQTV